MSKNCLTGTIPKEICELPKISSIIADALSLGNDCAKEYKTSHRVHGHFPTCLWSIPTLKTLHLSSNLLSGSIPNLPEFDRSVNQLNDIIASYNNLEGYMPNFILENQFDTIDLSRNKIAFSINSNISVIHRLPNQSNSTSINFRINRLSGKIPYKVLDSYSKIDVLEGNNFDCKPKDLPSTDPSSNTYTCGSETLDNTLYVLLACTILILFYIIFKSKFLRPSRIMQYLTTLKSLFIKSKEWVVYSRNISFEKYPRIKQLIDVLRITRIVGVFLSVVTLIITSIIYSSIKESNEKYSTVEFQYEWYLSFAYLKGITPTIILFFVWLLLCLIILAFILSHSKSETIRERFYNKTTTSNIIIEDSKLVNENNKLEDHSTFKSNSQIFCTILIAFIFVSAVNVGYVYLLLNSNREFHVLLQLLMATFKLTWNMICVDLLISNVLVHRLKVPITWQFKTSLKFLMIVFNNILAPILATAFTDSKCFNELIILPDKIVSNYFYPYCSTTDPVTGICLVYDTFNQSFDFQPPFIYSNQCASRLLVNYVPMVILIYSALSVLVPLSYIILSYSTRLSLAK